MSTTCTFLCAWCRVHCKEAFIHQFTNEQSETDIWTLLHPTVQYKAREKQGQNTLHIRAMDDSSMSASQLRQRYGRGGTAMDSELSAAQLRARYDIDNSKFGK